MPASFQSFAEWHAARRAALSRGGLWLAGNEPGRPVPADFDRAKLRLLICRLSTYDDVAASITHRLLLQAALAVPGVYADLAFLPPEADSMIMRKDSVPPWLATGCKRAPGDFDVVAISLSVQQEAANLPAVLQESGLRLDAAGRRADEKHPFIILGGHGAGSVPFIHGDAAGLGSGGLVDAGCLGDGIGWLQEFLRRRLAARKSGAGKAEFLESLARELPGTYVPALYRHVQGDGNLTAIEPLQPGLPLPVEHRRDPPDTWLNNYDGAYIPFTAEETEETLPLAMGCAYRCRFCQTGWLRAKLDSAPRDALAAAAVRFKAAMVNSDLNLLASDACSVSDLDQILDDLRPLFRDVSVKSLSVSSLVRRPESFRLLRRLAKHEFTFGVEGVSARLRAWLGKPATAADLLQIAGALAPGGLRQLKLFFIATGLEEERDLTELAQLLKGLRAKVPGCRLIASFMPLFHAPFTPLQFAPVHELTAHQERVLSGTVRQAGGEFRWSAQPGEIALMNRLCRAGRAATPLLVEFSLRRGLRYGTALSAGPARELLQMLPADAAEKSADAIFPWSDQQAAADSKTLWKSYRHACRELEAPPEAMAASTPPPTRNSPGETRIEPERRHFWLHVPAELAAHPDHVIVRGALRALFARWPDGVSAYLGAPRLVRPPGAAGLLPASAEFRRGTPALRASPGLEPAELSAVPEASLLFGIRWPDVRIAENILRAFKENRIKFQTVRRGASRWQVVERAFRGKTGIMALQETDGHVLLFCRQNPVLHGFDPAAGPAGIVQVVLAETGTACAMCKGAQFRALKAVGPEMPPVCFDCLIRPGRG